MTAPGSMHQMISFRLASLLDAFILQNKGQCKTGISAFDIYLFKDDNRTVVQPDVFVVCDRRKFSARGIEGAPDMIIEILSPSTRAKDQGIKL